MSYKVLVVDDEDLPRDLFSDLLRKKEGCEVKTAASGEAALGIVKNEDFDAILLDVNMPGIDGIETLKRVREIKPKAIVIMLTALGYDPEVVSRARALGCSGYIGKNMAVPQILSTFKLFVKQGKENLEKG